jgi:hypothetical protein
MIIGDSITIRTVQGVGDILWVYQKLEPYFNTINIVICVINLDCPVQKRCLPFLKTLPKVLKTKLKLVTSKKYDELAKIKKKLTGVIDEYKKGVFPIEYAVNKFLEDGVRIDEIDDPLQFPITETVDLITKPVDIPFEKYMILYISGNKIVQEYYPQKYVDIIKETFSKFNNKLPIVLLGAEYDMKHLEIAKNLLNKLDIQTEMYINMSFPEVNHVIKQSSYFFGYQSGLNIIADQFDIPQTMLYFDFLDNILNTWAKHKNIISKIYNPHFFKENITYLENFYFVK